MTSAEIAETQGEVDLLLRAGVRCTGRCSSRRTRTPQERIPREVERGDRLLAANGRDLPEEVIEGFTAFEIVEERLDRHSRADENGRSPENLGIAAHDLAQLRKGSTSVWPRAIDVPSFSV